MENDIKVNNYWLLQFKCSGYVLVFTYQTLFKIEKFDEENLSMKNKSEVIKMDDLTGTYCHLLKFILFFNIMYIHTKYMNKCK